MTVNEETVTVTVNVAPVERRMALVYEHQGITLTIPQGLDRREALKLLHTVASVMLGDLTPAVGLTQPEPEPEEEADLGDGRSWPRRKIVRRSKGNRERLECGHTFVRENRFQRPNAKSRQCRECALEALHAEN